MGQMSFSFGRGPEGIVRVAFFFFLLLLLLLP